MKKCILIIISFLALNFKTNAQTYVTIPDASFVTWLQTNYPSCMSGNQMDIDCGEIVNETSMYFENTSISDLTGVEYFTNLISLICPRNQLTSLPNLPQSLMNLICIENHISSLISLPPSLVNFRCSNNELNSLPNLPVSLKGLDCINNTLSYLPNLPNGLTSLFCGNNNLSILPNLPDSLTFLSCDFNELIALPNLNNSLTELSCSNNLLTTIPTLPPTLEILNVNQNQLSSLPNLPTSLYCLRCNFNSLVTLPILPNNLVQINCENNQLISLPNLPDSIFHLDCSNNQITILPNLPTNIYYLYCQNNNIVCFPIFPNSITSINIATNPFTCLPNYLPVMDALTLTMALCSENDFINNPHGCSSSKGISGNVFAETYSNCVIDESDNLVRNFSLKLYDENALLLNQTFTFLNGKYQFQIDSGNYVIKIDTLDVPFAFQCANLGMDTNIILSSQNLFANHVNFPLTCKPGFDIGTQSVLTNGWVFPGQNHEVKILSGDMSQWYNMACASGISGEVQVSVSGPVTFQNTSNGTLTPNVSGNSFTYSISDFGTLDFFNSFGLIFKTDTTAQGGDEICVSVDVTPNSGDNNTSNNHYEFCYLVGNSYDPNMKEVYPVNVEPGFEDYFTYTIHFQNTGSAPAFNIRLLDTLDANLDLETFQVINYSHYNTTMVKNNVLTFHFPNIMLADSTSDLEGSKGYVQYRIKPKANLPLGTEIKNTANIYFDFNEPIVTNTTVNKYVEENAIQELEKVNVKVYPNPFNNQTTIEFSKAMVNSEIKIYNIFGQEVFMSSKINGNKLVIDRGNNPSGIYFVKVTSSKMESQTLKLIVKD